MNHKNLIARRFSAVAFLAIAITGTGFFPSSAQASPSDEISRAVIAAGAPSVKQADASTFAQGFSSVVIRKKCKDIVPYITAAIRLRPDFAPQIAVAALKTHRRHGNDVTCDCVDPIIRAAIAAAPDEKKAIVRAAIEAEPWSRECTLAAAGQTETETAFFRPPGVDAGNINSSAIGTINPANIIGIVNTDEQRP
jgi:hypothetical protein